MILEKLGCVYIKYLPYEMALKLKKKHFKLSLNNYRILATKELHRDRILYEFYLSEYERVEKEIKIIQKLINEIK